MDARNTDEVIEEVIDVVEVEDVPEADLEVDPIVREVDDAAPSNPDSWLQWALIIGLLALFLICTILILVAWRGR